MLVAFKISLYPQPHDACAVCTFMFDAMFLCVPCSCCANLATSVPCICLLPCVFSSHRLKCFSASTGTPAAPSCPPAHLLYSLVLQLHRCRCKMLPALTAAARGQSGLGRAGPSRRVSGGRETTSYRPVAASRCTRSELRVHQAAGSRLNGSRLNGSRHPTRVDCVPHPRAPNLPAGQQGKGGASHASLY